ncbi:MAG TPA: hypothetical protein VN682_00695 [Terriglobales bacterium]|nr:hypothetical protein [Terriglobales bacterium]
MPYTVDVEKMSDRPGKPAIPSMDPAKPPVKAIPFMEFPKVVYMHPKEAYRVVIHRNAQHEIVEQEHIPSEHLTRVVADAKELTAALKEGWVKQPYIAQPPPDPNAHLYDRA